MTESLIAAIERLGHAVEHGADRGAAIRELCAVLGPGLTGPDVGALLDDWRNVRRRYDVIKDAPPGVVAALLDIRHAEGGGT